MKHISIFILTVLLLNSIAAQDNKPCGCNDELSFEPKLVGHVFILPQGLNSKTFISELPFASDVYLVQNEKVTNVNLTYNGYLDELIWQEPNKLKMVQLDKELITGFRVYKFNSDTNVLFEQIHIKKIFLTDSAHVFAQLLLQNKVSLFAYHTIYISEVEKLTYKEKIFYKNIFKPKTIYFFKLSNNKTIGFEKFRKKHLYALFPDKKEAMSQKFKEFKQRRFRTEDDLVQITKILNQLF
jgi:hypothetical protein